MKRGLEGNTGAGTEGAGAGWVPPGVAELAGFFPELDVLELVGRGGMGAVYKARQKSLDRVVALKILPPEISGRLDFAARFTQEAQAMARLSHPHIVTIFDYGVRERGQWSVAGGQPAEGGSGARGVHFFVMEFVDGTTLRQVMHGGEVAAKDALAIVPQICEALQYAHDRGIVHRDIKPENILLTRAGQVKIADFGLAKLIAPTAAGETRPPAGSGETVHSTVAGTPAYMAPEQRATPGSVDHRADIYAVGVVFYQLLTGELPPKEAGKLRGELRRVRVDVRLDEIVLRALEKEPGRRYASAGEMKTEVETVVGAGATGAEESGGAESGDLQEARHQEGSAQAQATASPVRERALRQVRGPSLGLRIIEGRQVNAAGPNVWKAVAGYVTAVVALLVLGLALSYLTSRMLEIYREYHASLPGLTAHVFSVHRFFGTSALGAMMGLMIPLLVPLPFLIADLAGARQHGLRRAYQAFVVVGLCLFLGLFALALLLPTFSLVQRLESEPAAEGKGPATGKVFHTPAEILAGLPTDARPTAEGWDEFSSPKADLWLSERIAKQGCEIVARASVRAVELRRISPKGKPLETLHWVAELTLDPGTFEFNGCTVALKLNSQTPWDPNATRIPLHLNSSTVAIAGDEAFARQARSLKPGDQVMLRGMIDNTSVWSAPSRTLWILMSNQSMELPRTPHLSAPVEVLLNDLDMAHGQEALRLSDGSALSLPPNFDSRTPAEREQWLNDNRIDLLVDFARDRWGFLSRDVTFCTLEGLPQPVPFENVSVSTVFGTLAVQAPALEKVTNASGMFHVLPKSPTFPLNLSFRSRDAVGAIQVEPGHLPHQLKLRIRRLQAQEQGPPSKAAEQYPEVIDLATQLQLLQSQFEGRLRIRTEQHPEVVNLRTQQVALQKKLEAATQRAASGAGDVAASGTGHRSAGGNFP